VKQIFRKARNVLRFIWEEYAEARESAVHYGAMFLYALGLWFLFVTYPFWAGVWFCLWPGLTALAIFKSDREKEREELREEISRYRRELETIEKVTRARIEQEVEEKWRSWAEKSPVIGSHPDSSPRVACSRASDAPAPLTGSLRPCKSACPTKASDTDEAPSPETLAVEFIDTTFDCHGPLPFNTVLAQAKELGVVSEVVQCFPSAYEVVYFKTAEGSRAHLTSPNAVHEEWTPMRIREFLSGPAPRNQAQRGGPHEDDERAVAENPGPSSSPFAAQDSRTRKRAEEDIWALGKYQPPEWMKDRVYRVKFDPLAWKGLQDRVPLTAVPSVPSTREEPLSTRAALAQEPVVPEQCSDQGDQGASPVATGPVDETSGLLTAMRESRQGSRLWIQFPGEERVLVGVKGKDLPPELPPWVQEALQVRRAKRAASQVLEEGDRGLPPPPNEETVPESASTPDTPTQSSPASPGRPETVRDLLERGWKVKTVRLPSDPRPDEPLHPTLSEVQTSETLWAPPGTDPAIFTVRVPVSAKSLTIREYRHLLSLMMAERAERDRLTGAGVITALGPAIGEGAAEQILVEWEEDPNASPEREIWRAIDLAWEVSILDQALGMAGMPEKGPLEVAPMSDVNNLVARESVSDLGLEDWAQQVPDGPDRA